MKPSARVAILGVVGPYMLVSGLWILLSDSLLEALALDPSTRTTLAMSKGWAFVIVTSMLLALLLHARVRALQSTQDHLRALSSRLESSREEERTRIAREIHDDLGQMLTAIKMDLRWLELRLEAFGDDPRLPPLFDKIAEASSVADATVRSIQRIGEELRPGLLDKLGLGAAIAHEAARFQQRSGIAVRVVVPETGPNLASEAATAFFRILQEALTNVARHARARNVEIELHLGTDSDELAVRDDGIGIGSAVRTDSLGLLGMRERARLLGGDVSFLDGPTGGTLVRVRLPHRHPP